MSHTLTLSNPDPALSRVASLLDRLFPPPAPLTFNGTHLPAVERPGFSLILKHPGTL
jgi:hypothetical protein